MGTYGSVLKSDFLLPWKRLNVQQAGCAPETSRKAKMNSTMMEAAQKLMSKLSREDKERMTQMSKSVDPAMVQQAWQMMSDPATAQQAMERMGSMSGDDIKSSLNQAAATPAASMTVLAKLKASTTEVPAMLLALVEKAEAAKTKVKP